MVKIKELLILQNKLNTETNGPDWITGISKNERVINWDRCIHMEASEAIDSLSWKHWKDINAKNNWDNLKIEVVDIFHFILSKIISDFGIEYGEFLFLEEYKKFKKLNFVSGQDNKIEEIIVVLERIQILSLNRLNILIEFFRLIDLIENFTLEDIEKLYIGKNCLNQFRQDNGYKNGTYIKIWNGKEDNVFMQNYLNKSEEISYEDLRLFLEKTYLEVIKNVE